jgi:hypothetical protein
VCVRGAAGGAQIQIILDNVAAGHRWPSGSAQDRRAWVEVQAFAGGAAVYQSGVVPANTSPTASTDPDLWLLLDCMLDESGKEVHMFWEAADYESNLLPGQLTFDSSDPRFYQTHVVQQYPRDGSLLSTYPDRVTVQVHLAPFGLDVIDALALSGDLEVTGEAGADALRAKLAPLAVGTSVEWTADGATERYIEGGLPVACVSTTNLVANADKVPAVNHQRCAP